ncbi:calcium-binding protein [Nocardioides humilatus]|uniref:Calcium-binding protein n=1 Tax=Nocardioides humilatus TaxID=2607660 RepID=A0A5B1LHV4_9ACTN|nr:calcium-binding protein [Nocardioides humilatus]KAA1420232.1 calcium-binding protein [Nocardioides humilatus]
MLTPRTRRRSARRATAILLVISALVVAPAFVQAAAGQPDPTGPAPRVSDSAAAHASATKRIPAQQRVTRRDRSATPYRAAPVAGKPGLDPGTPGASCAEGWWYFGFDSDIFPSQNFTVQLWDDDTSSTDDLLATGVTDAEGHFSLCFESTDGEGGGQEVYPKFVSNNLAWRIRDTAAGNHDYTFQGPTFPYADPGFHSFGSQTPPNSDLDRMVHAYDEINKLWLWQNHTYMDNLGDTRQMIVNWTPTSVDGNFYSPASNDIHLAAAAPDNEHTVIHLGANALMDALYDDAYPAVTNCSPHPMFADTSATCAWVEGWADWATVRALGGDPVYVLPDNSTVDLENQDWTTNTGATGDDVEGRVAGALIDLTDMVNEQYWDRTGGYDLYLPLYNGLVSDTFNEYFNTDLADGLDLNYYPRASVFQNTIDYKHRDPLETGVPLTRPSLPQFPSPHNYSFTTSPDFPTWSGVAVRAQPAANYDLRLYGDEALTSALTTSSEPAGKIDYVVVDGTQLTGTLFPRAFGTGGAGGYSIEEWSGEDLIDHAGVLSSSFAAGDIIQVDSLLVTGGSTEYVGIQPSAGLDVSVAAHLYSPDDPDTDVAQPRSGAIAQSPDVAAGEASYFTYSPFEDAINGLVVLNESGTAGTYTLYVDDAPPTGTVEIDDGQPLTYDTSVDLTLSASANVPITEMRITTDGGFDTEPWVPYSPTATVTVPGGPGTKTVLVNFRSAAGATSALAAIDDIRLYDPPTCHGVTATVAGNGTVVGTSGADVIVGGPGVDEISGFGGDDLICGFGGNDTINDGLGSDTVYAAEGNDLVRSVAAVDINDQFDEYWGGPGTDQMSYGARSSDTLVSLENGGTNDGAATGEFDSVFEFENVTTGSGNDTITGDTSANRLMGNGGADTISGADGNDYLAGADGADTLRGDGGNDTILAGNGDDIVNEGSTATGTDLIKGGTGFDRISYASRTASVAIRLNGVPTSGAAGENDKLLNLEYAVGGSGADTLVGHTTADRLHGNAGDDTISGNGGNDIIVAGPGADTANGGNGNDSIDTIDGVGGNDTANGGTGTDTATTDPGDIRLNIP